MHHGTGVTHVPWCTSGSLDPRWRGKRSRHSRRMRNPQFYVSGKRPIIKTFTRHCWQTLAYQPTPLMLFPRVFPDWRYQELITIWFHRRMFIALGVILFQYMQCYLLRKLPRATTNVLKNKSYVGLSKLLRRTFYLLRRTFKVLRRR